jgi:hypothetical protein
MVQQAARSRRAMMARAAGDSGVPGANVTQIEQIYDFDIIAQVAEALDGSR